MRRSVRRALLTAAGLAVAVIAAVAIAASFIPEERVAAVVADRAEAVLGQPVRVATARLRILPLPTVRLSGVAVGVSSDSSALAAADAVELRPRILPLFRGRVVIRRLALERPRLLVEIDAAGRPNFPLLEAAPRPSAAATSDSDIAFAIDEVAVDNGRIGYRDLRDGTVVRFDGWTQRMALTGRLERGMVAEVSLRGWIEVDDVDARLPAVVLPSRDLRLRVEHDATLYPQRERVRIQDMDLSLNGVTLSGQGTIDSVTSSEGRHVRLQLAAAGLDAAELLAWAPVDSRRRLALPDGRPLELTGTAEVNASLVGPLTAVALPDLDAAMTGSEIGLSVDGEPLAEGVRVEAVASLDSLRASASGRALGHPFQLRLAARDPASPSLTVALTGRADLGRLVALELVPDTTGLEGVGEIDLRAHLALERLGDSHATGTIRLTDVLAAGLDPAVAVPIAALRLEGERLIVEPLRIELGADAVPVEVELTALGWIPALVDSLAPPPRIELSIRADSLDLDALLGPSESDYPDLFFARLRDRPVDGRSAADVAEASGLVLPPLPPVQAGIDAAMTLLVRNGLRYHDLVLEARLSPAEAVLGNVRFGFLGGTVEASGRAEPVQSHSIGRVAAARVTGRYALSGVGAEPFFDRLTPFRDHLSGHLDLAGTAAMTLDRHALPDRATITADGTIAVADGQLASWPVLQAVTRRLGLAAYDTLRFRDWAGSYSVAGPLVTLDETVLQGQELDARAAGSFDLGGRIDAGATLYLTRALAQRAGSLGDQVATLAGTDGRVPVGVRITGNVESPQVALDLSEARTAVVDRAREAAREEGRRVGQRVADRVAREAADEVAERLELPDSLRGLPPESLRARLGDSLYGLVPDSLKVPVDTIADRAEQALRDRLRRLVPRGGGGGGDEGGGGGEGGEGGAGDDG